MKLVTLEDTLAVLDYAALIDHMEQAHRQARALVDDSYVGVGEHGVLSRTAVAPGESMGSKLVSFAHGNVDLPTIHAVTVLFDGATGEPLAVIDALALTWFKTACDSALGSRLLSRHDASHLAMVGAGAVAPHLIAAHRCVRPSIERVTIWNRTTDKAHRLAAQLDGVEAEVVERIEDAVVPADVVSAATASPTPLIRGEWLRPGAHLDLVGAYLPDTREADDSAITRSRLFVDARSSACEIGELAIPLATGVISPTDIVGDLYELCAGAVPGRRTDADITLFKNGGGGHLDLMAAQHVLGRLGYL